MIHFVLYSNKLVYFSELKNNMHMVIINKHKISNKKNLIDTVSKILVLD